MIDKESKDKGYSLEIHMPKPATDTKLNTTVLMWKNMPTYVVADGPLGKESSKVAVFTCPHRARALATTLAQLLAADLSSNAYVMHAFKEKLALWVETRPFSFTFEFSHISAGAYVFSEEIVSITPVDGHFGVHPPLP